MPSHIQVSQWSNPDYKVSQAEIQAYLDDYEKALTTTLAELMIWYLQDEDQINNSSKEHTNCIQKILADSDSSVPDRLNIHLTSDNQEVR